MNETTTASVLTGTETAISLFEILGIILPLVGVLMQVTIRAYLEDDHDLSYKVQHGSLLSIMISLILLIITGGAFLDYLLDQSVTSPLTAHLIVFGAGLLCAAVAPILIIGEVLGILSATAGEAQSSEPSRISIMDPRLAEHPTFQPTEQTGDTESGNSTSDDEASERDDSA
jgi:hypothetical protein